MDEWNQYAFVRLIDDLIDDLIDAEERRDWIKKPSEKLSLTFIVRCWIDEINVGDGIIFLETDR